MADWTPIPNSALEPGKPIRAVDALALRDNPIAAFEGRPGVPTLEYWAFARTTIAAGTTERYARAEAFLTSLNTYAEALRVQLMDTGSLRVGWTQGRGTGGSGGPEAQLFRERAGSQTQIGSTVGNTNNAAQEAKTLDCTGLEPGDSVVLKVRTNSGGQQMQFYDFWLGTTGALLHPVPNYFRWGTAPA